MVRPFTQLLTALLATLVVLAPAGALAHDELHSSDPADGATVEAPEELVLRFSGDIAQVGAQLQISGAGRDLADGSPVVQGSDLVQPLTDLAPGDYEVVWRVTSSDGHPISGELGFTVQGDATGEAMAVEATPDEQAAEDATAEGATEEDATEPVEPTQEDSAQSADPTGLPAWVWIFLGVAVLGLVALLARTWSRGRS